MDVSRSSSNTTWLPAVRTFVTVWPATARSTILTGDVSLDPQATRSATAKQGSARKMVEVGQTFATLKTQNLIIRNSRFSRGSSYRARPARCAVTEPLFKRRGPEVICYSAILTKDD